MVALSHVDDVASIIAASIGNEKAHKQVSITHALLPVSCHVNSPFMTVQSIALHRIVWHAIITPHHITSHHITSHHTILRNTTAHHTLYTTLHQITSHHTTPHCTTDEVLLHYITSHQVFNCGTDKFVSYNSLCKAIAKAASCKYSTARTHYIHRVRTIC
jgi:hypothetical protein